MSLSSKISSTRLFHWFIDAFLKLPFVNQSQDDLYRIGLRKKYPKNHQNASYCWIDGAGNCDDAKDFDLWGVDGLPGSLY